MSNERSSHWSPPAVRIVVIANSRLNAIGAHKLKAGARREHRDGAGCVTTSKTAHPDDRLLIDLYPRLVPTAISEELYAEWFVARRNANRGKDRRLVDTLAVDAQDEIADAQTRGLGG